MAKTQLKYVGNFIELGYDDHVDPPSLVKLRGLRTADHKAEVVAYLRNAPVFIMSPGNEEDVLDERKLAGSRSVLSDGLYAWPKVLAYYVDTYDVQLPEAFEAHMRKRDWKVPTQIDPFAIELPR